MMPSFKGQIVGGRGGVSGSLNVLMVHSNGNNGKAMSPLCYSPHALSPRLCREKLRLRSLSFDDFGDLAVSTI